jgi:hypothetical protein
MKESVPPFSNLSAVILALRGSLGAWGKLGWLGEALAWLVYRRLGEVCGKLERMVARYQAGRLWRRGVRVSGGLGEGAVRRRVSRERIWPRKFGWLVRAASWQAAGFGSQLRAVLEHPEMVAFLQAAPQAARVLGPVCRMLAIEPAVLRPGVVVEPRVRVKRVRRVVEKPDLGRVPIPRGAMAVVRRERLKNG